MKFRFKGQSIQKKIIISSLIVTVIPLIMLEMLFLYLNQQRNVASILDSASVYADNLEERYRSEMNKLERLADTLRDFTPLDTYLSSDYDTPGEAFSYYLTNVHPMLESCSDVYENVVVRVYHNNRDIQNFSGYINNEWSHFVEQLFPGEKPQQPAAGWVKSNIRHYRFYSVYSYYLAVYSDTYPYEGLYGVSVHANEKFFHAPISSELQEGSLVIVMDNDGCILSASDRSLSGETVEELGLDRDALHELRDRQRISVDGVEYYLFHRETNNLHILYLVDHDWAYSTHRETVTILVISGILLIFLAGYLIIKIIRNLTSHIAILKQKMTNIDRERIRALAVDDNAVTTEDEIEQLDAVFTGMMREIDLLMERTQQQEDRLKDAVIMRQQAEIQALQHQINPHYLFNTLETIRMKLIMKHNREDAEIVKLFAESFRRYVDLRDEFVPLFEEVAFIRKYIRIQNYRLNNKIQFTCVANDSLLRYNVPKLLLQPLVENAVCHGVEEKENSGEIVLRIEKTRETLEIYVEDDGVGMSQEKLADLHSAVYSSQPNRSVGMQNVYQRIRLTYGERAAMKIESIEGVGTAVQLTLPLEELEGR